MKIVLASILSCLALMLGMFTTTGTVSAHTQTPLHRPNISVDDVQRFGNCVNFQLFGSDFSPRHHAQLDAAVASGEEDASIDPDRVRINRDGEFDREVEVCANDQFANCGDFIDNPFFFCGFGLNPDEFCNFNFEPSDFCFGQPFCPHFQCGFHPISVLEFCRFHEEHFCFFHRHHFLTFLIRAQDEHSGRESNTVAITIRTGF